MKKLLLVIIPCLLLQSLAMAAPQRNLRSVIDDYRYSTTVEWDQHDKAELDLINAKFVAELKGLASEGALTMAEVRSVFQAQKDVDPAALEILKNENGEVVLENLRALIEERSESLYSSGSSWAPPRPGDILLYGILALVMMEIAVLIITSTDDVCPNPTSYPESVRYDCIWPN